MENRENRNRVEAEQNILWLDSFELQDLLEDFATKRRSIIRVPIRHMNCTDKPLWTLGKKDSPDGAGLPYS
jgi:hypothetical protein